MYNKCVILSFFFEKGSDDCELKVMLSVAATQDCGAKACISLYSRLVGIGTEWVLFIAEENLRFFFHISVIEENWLRLSQ